MIVLAANHPKTVLFCAAIMLAGALFFAWRIKIESDFLALIPEQNPAVNDFRSTVERFGSIDTLLAVVEMDPEGDQESYLAYADFFAEGLRNSPMINWVEYRLKDFANAAEDLMGYAPLFLQPDELDRFLSRFEEDAIRANAERVSRQLRSPLDVAMKDLLTKDPMGMLPILSRQFDQGELESRFQSDSGYLIDSESRYLLMLIKPTGAAADIPYDRALMAALDELKLEVDAQWLEDGWEGTPPGVFYGGGYPIALEDSRLIIKDMGLGAVVALVLVVILFTLAFGRPTAAVIAFVPLMAGLVLTFGFAALALNKLNSATSAFAALLIGLGIDFIIVLYGRYLEERKGGATHRDAILAMGNHTAVGVLLGAVTTAATFYAFLKSEFRGLGELGLLTGSGILIVVITVFMVLPALLTLIEKNRPLGAYHLRSFGLQKLCGFSIRHSKPVLVVSSLILIVSAIAALGLRYDDDILNMKSENNSAAANQKIIMDAFGIRFTPMMVRVDGASEAEVISKVKQLLPKLEQLADGQILAKVDTLVSFLPDHQQQREVLARIHQFDFDPVLFKQQFDGAFSAQGLNPRAFQAGFENLTKAMKVDSPLSINDLKDTAVGHLLDRYLNISEGSASAMIFCYPPAEKKYKGVPAALSQLIAETPDTLITGPVAISQELKKIVWKDASIAAVIGLLIVFIFLALDLGGPRAAIFALIPLGLGMVCMAGAMVLLNLDVNFMNIFVFTMIIGIGVDYGIHLIHRWQETDGAPEAATGTARAIVIAALTTIAGFGSLTLSHYPGLQSMGAVAILGASLTALVSITLLPALLQETYKRKQNQ